MPKFMRINTSAELYMAQISGRLVIGDWQALPIPGCRNRTFRKTKHERPTTNATLPCTADAAETTFP